MARTIARLTANDLLSPPFTEPGTHWVDDGLYLQVAGPKSRSWIFRYTLKGKTRWAGLGSAESVTLAEAKLKRDVERVKVKRGMDPVAERKLQQENERNAREPKKSFRQCFEAYLADNHANWKNVKHRQQWRNTIETYAFPTIADLPIDAIQTSHIIEILRPIWIEKNETARRVRGRIEAIIDYASDPDDKSYQNPAKLTKLHIKKKLPKRPGPKSPRHHPAMPYAELPGFMAELRQREGITARALEFLILNAVRTGDVIGNKREERPPMRWNHVDLDKRTWTIPATKNGAAHSVPLSDAALDVLKSMKALHLDDMIVFPSVDRPGQPLSDGAMSAVLARLKRSDVTVHGFRSTFKDWASECTSFPNEVSEMALAHAIEDKTEAAYRRGDLFEKRRRLMTAWADYCVNGSGEVVAYAASA